jgi:HEAT repeat protein
MERLGDENPEVRAMAVLSLGRHGKGSEKIEEALKKFENDQDPGIRMSLMLARAFMGKPDESSIPDLMEALASKETAFSEAATSLLETVSTKSPEKVLPPVVKMLEQPDHPAAQRAMSILRVMRENAVSALPVVAALYDKSDTKVRVDVIRTLTTIDKDGEQALPITIKALEDLEVKIRRQALQSLPAYRKKSDLFLRPLIGCLKDNDEENRILALGIIRGLASNASDVVSAVISLAKDPSQNVRTPAISTLGAFNPSSPEIIAALKHVIEEGNTVDKAVTVAALRRIGTAQPQDVIPILEKALEAEKDDKLKQTITNALASLTKKPGEPSASSNKEEKRKHSAKEKESQKGQQ